MHANLAVQTSGSVVPFASLTMRAFTRLQSWDLTNVKARLIKDGEYKPEEIEEVETEYKKYLALCIGHPGVGFPTPIRIDAMWHQHILFTRDYAAMCQQIAGRFLHHSPFVGDEKPSPEGRTALRELYEREFGTKPGALWGPNPKCCKGHDHVKHKDTNCGGPCNSCGDIRTAARCEDHPPPPCAEVRTASCFKDCSPSCEEGGTIRAGNCESCQAPCMGHCDLVHACEGGGGTDSSCGIRPITGSWTVHAGLCQSQCDSKCGPCKSS